MIVKLSTAGSVGAGWTRAMRLAYSRERLWRRSITIVRSCPFSHQTCTRAVPSFSNSTRASSARGPAERCSVSVIDSDVPSTDGTMSPS
jgi:hypothetical protein